MQRGGHSFSLLAVSGQLVSGQLVSGQLVSGQCLVAGGKGGLG
jgi:hypothetical protein